MSTIFSDNLQKIINQPAKWAREHRVPYQNLHKYLTGDREPKVGAAAELADAAGVSLDWLAGREGAQREFPPPSHTTYAKPTQSGQFSLQEDSAEYGQDLIRIPELNVDLAAGSGVVPADHELVINHRAFSREWLKQKSLQAEKCYLVRVSGESMSPWLKNQDLLLVDTARTTPAEDYPYAFRYENTLLVKLLQRIDRSTLRVVSVNSAFPPWEINLGSDLDFAILGAVVWHAHTWI